MLIRFSVSNFMSFKDETEFNMLTSKGNGSRLLNHHIVKTTSGIDVLKTAAIYGANAAGKSNLAKAIDYLKDLIINEVLILVPQSNRFRLDSSYKNKPTIFKIELEYKDTHYEYAIEIYKGKIHEEWLYKIISVPKNKDELLYNRKENKVTLGEYFKKLKEYDYIEKYISKELQEHQTVVNLLYDVIEEDKIIDDFCEAFSKIHVVTPDSFNIEYTKSILLGKKSIDFSKKLLSESNTGIEDIILSKQKADYFFGHDDADFKNDLIDKLENKLEKKSKSIKKPSIVFRHNYNYYAFIKEQDKYFVLVLNTLHKNSISFDFEEESDGTNRLFQLSPAFEELLHENDVVYIIDELERSMHPILAKELLKLYSTSSTTNSQLIFTTHESHLLDNDLLRRDEIWFTEKREDGSTEFYPLSGFNPRGDKIIERGYLQGRYGGIPYLGNLKQLTSLP